MKYLFFLCLLTLLFAVTITAQEQYDKSVKEKINYRRIETSQLLNTDFQQPKEQVFPLGWNTSTLGKVTTGTGVWTELNPNVPRVDYLGIHFVNPDTGWAVGDLGTLIKTTDGGISWVAKETNTATPILKVRSYNGQIVIASGFSGLILRSTDGGESWAQVTSGVTGDLWGLDMLNDTVGFACGNANSLTKTTDGGISWQRIFTPGYTSDYWWIDFLNESYGFIAANGKALRTTDSGNNWEIIQAGDDYPLFSIDIIDSLHIAAAGYGGPGYFAKNIYSSDGGFSWINGGQLTFETVNCIQYVNPDTGYLVMNTVSARKTTNRGQEWIPIGGISDNYELQFFEQDNIGYSAGTGLKISKAEGNLDEWNRLIINDNFSDVFFVNEHKGFVISSTELSAPSGLYKTIDGGINWEIVSGAPNGVDLLFLDSLTEFIGSNIIYKTTDGGETWYAPSGGTGGAGKIFFINETTGWAVRSNIIYKSTDRGENWFTQFTALPGISFSSIHFVDSLYGWTANSDRPFKTTDSGANWIHQTNLDIWQSRDVFFIDYLIGFLLESNELHKTTDGGITWVQNPNLTGFSIAELSTYEDSTIFIIGYKTYRSIDGGENWYEFTELNGIRITGLSLLNKGFGFAVGELGLIMQYVDSTYIPVELLSFYGEAINNKVILSWKTATEINNQGFEIERTDSKYQIWKNIGYVQGNGTTTEEHRYSFAEIIDKPANYYYRLKQVDFDGTFEYSKIIEVIVNSPLQYNLSQNYPNPFNSSTIITYQIPGDEFVTLKVYDVLGSEVAVLIEENKKAGYHKTSFNAVELSTGIYFYKLTAGNYHSTKKFILLK